MDNSFHFAFFTLTAHHVTAAATGSSHSLVLTSNGDVYGFGANIFGQLGIGNYEPSISTPTRMLSKKIFVKVGDIFLLLSVKCYCSKPKAT